MALVLKKLYHGYFWISRDLAGKEKLVILIKIANINP